MIVDLVQPLHACDTIIHGRRQIERIGPITKPKPNHNHFTFRRQCAHYIVSTAIQHLRVRPNPTHSDRPRPTDPPTKRRGKCEGLTRGTHEAYRLKIGRERFLLFDG